MTPLLLSGPIGSRLIDLAASRGVVLSPAEAAREALGHGPQVARIISEYADAGADIILAPAIGVTSLNRWGLDPLTVNRRAVDICRKAAPGLPVAPMVAVCEESVDAKAYIEQCAMLLDAGADMLMLETLTSSEAARALTECALDAEVHTGCEVPVHISLTPVPGLDIAAAASELMQYTPASIGLNCFYPASQVAELLPLFPATTISLRPAASMPGQSALSPEEFSDALRPALADSRTGYIGTCCGATPIHTEYLKNLIHD